MPEWLWKIVGTVMLVAAAYGAGIVGDCMGNYGKAAQMRTSRESCNTWSAYLGLCVGLLGYGIGQAAGYKQGRRDRDRL